MTAKKTVVKKTPAKRKPAKKKPVTPVAKTTREIPWRLIVRYAAFGGAMLLFGAAGGVWSAGGIAIGPGRNDVLQRAYDADRVTQIAVLRDMAAQGFKNDDSGREQATTWFNENRFRNRPTDFRPYTSAVTDSFAAGTLEEFADKLEGAK